jgi:hypothetical protein
MLGAYKLSLMVSKGNKHMDPQIHQMHLHFMCNSPVGQVYYRPRTKHDNTGKKIIKKKKTKIPDEGV